MSNKEAIIMIGAGGHAKVLVDVINQLGIKIIGIVDPNKQPGSICLGVPVLGDDDIVATYSPDEIKLVNGIGAMPNNMLRLQVADKMRKNGFSFTQVIHPSSIIADDVNLDEGVQVMAGVIIQPGSQVGQDSILNTGVLIDHDCNVGSNCHLAPGVTLSGGVHIGNKTHLGTGSVSIEGVSIGSNCVIAAGSIVYKDLQNDMKYIQKRKEIISRV